MTVATHTTLDQHRSLFDGLKREGEDGEYWTARSLMSIYGYGRWDKFSVIIERAMNACARRGYDVTRHFVSTDFVDGHRHRKPDFNLSRYAAYFIALEGDTRKAEIAAAKDYFTIQTRRAEVLLGGAGLDDDIQQMQQQLLMIQQVRNDQRRLEITQAAHGESIADHSRQLRQASRELDEARRELDERRREMEKAAREMAELVERVGDVEHVTPLKDNTRLHSIKEAAQLLGYGEKEFFEILRNLGIIYRDGPAATSGGHKLYQRYIDEGWGGARWTEWPNGKGHSWVVKLTGKGIIKIKRRIDEGTLF